MSHAPDTPDTPTSGAHCDEEYSLPPVEALLAGLHLARQLMRPADVMLLATSSAEPGESLGQSVQAKHFKAVAMLLKTPHLMAVNVVSQVD